ncbi:MAG: hypothetical protein UV60_C0014G0013 [Parcubacteria group bacterium GW2011_GWA2_43_11]|nr:MAG: hypothetical protein UV60_C0014G0013 [Parcubacteria group bacterium GW2011_GWA2_43_11]
MEKLKNKCIRYISKKVFFLFEKVAKRYVTIILRPKYAVSVSPLLNFSNEENKTAILLQGPFFTVDNFTIETIKLYKKLFPTTQVIVSTWKEESPLLLQIAEKEGAIVVQSEKPKNRGPRNINMQIVSTYEGLKIAKKNDADYVIKSRTDQRFYSTEIFPFLSTLTKTFPYIGKFHKQKERIVLCSHETLKYRLYGATDQFQFGNIDDLLFYWGASLDERLPGVGNTDITVRDYAKSKLAETYLESNYLERIGRQLNWTIKDSWNAYAEHFIVVDKRTIDLYWPKYDHYREDRLTSYQASTTDYLTFKDWFLLYNNFPNSCPENILDLPFSSEIPEAHVR